ncbi:MAG TPA: hypothetical protein VE153_19415 [Myxococcus sp.]|jgi:hypothetical protein|nr:hypothetical protein [Myxococcus sp.]
MEESLDMSLLHACGNSLYPQSGTEAGWWLLFFLSVAPALLWWLRSDPINPRDSLRTAAGSAAGRRRYALDSAGWLLVAGALLVLALDGAATVVATQLFEFDLSRGYGPAEYGWGWSVLAHVLALGFLARWMRSTGPAAARGDVLGLQSRA